MTQHERDRVREALEYAIHMRQKADEERFGVGNKSCQLEAWINILNRWGDPKVW